MQELNKQESLKVPDVLTLIELIKAEQVVSGSKMAPFAIFNNGALFPSVMCAPTPIKRVQVGWDGAMFSVSEGTALCYYSESQITDVLPIGKPGLIPMM